jgi:hypothetical protein
MSEATFNLATACETGEAARKLYPAQPVGDPNNTYNMDTEPIQRLADDGKKIVPDGNTFHNPLAKRRTPAETVLATMVDKSSFMNFIVNRRNER